MSANVSAKGIRPAAVMLAVLFGLLGFGVLFGAASRSGSVAYGVFATCALFLFANAWLAARFPSGRVLYGLIINVPLWFCFIMAADPGQLHSAIIGLLACLAVAYLGMFFGMRFPAVRPRVSRLFFLVGVPIVLIALATFYFAIQRPTPIPEDKQEFVGRWKSASGFEVDIHMDGTASIAHNNQGAPNLNIAQGADNIERARVRFSGDSVLDVIVPGNYGRTYRVDVGPHADSAGHAMVLNATLLRRTP